MTDRRTKGSPLRAPNKPGMARGSTKSLQITDKTETPARSSGLRKLGPTALVTLCTHWPGAIIAACLALVVAATMFVATHFSLSSDTDSLIAKSLPWRQRETAFNRMFQPQGDQIVAVIDGRTPELTEAAAQSLADKLQGRPDLFKFVSRPDSSAFFQQNGLLFQTQGEVRKQLAQLIQAQPFLGPLAADPSLRGLSESLSTATLGVSSQQAKLADLNRPITALADTIDSLRAGRKAYFSWRNLISGKPAPARELRHIVLASPIQDFTSLQSGAAPSAFIRDAATKAGFDADHGVRMRLTGAIPLQDEEFATLGERAGLIATLALAAIIAMLWFAVRSVRLILAILVTTLVGLVCATACGLLIFHRFNVISVAFIPLFVGLGIDFGIQFSVRFRAEQSGDLDISQALVAAGRGMGRSLGLAATAIALGFLAFGPTAYVGVSQLGVIAGLGMFLALGLNLTLLPAMIVLLKPRPALSVEKQLSLERLDRVVLGHRRAVIGTALVAAAICTALLPWLRFDFNPLHLKSAKVESVATLRDLMRDPDASPDTLEVVAPNLSQARAVAQRLARLPQVNEVRTLASFIPDDQTPKLSAISDAALLLDLTLNPIGLAPPPTDAQTVASLRHTAIDLRGAATVSAPGTAAQALRLADDLEWLAGTSANTRSQVANVIMPGLETVLEQTRKALNAAPVTLESLPQELKQNWLSADGKARVSIVPRGNSDDNQVMDAFIKAVVSISPQVTGGPFDTQAGGKAVADAFLQAGVLSFVAITLLLLAFLRRTRDVAITMAPIVLTGLLTLGSCVALGMSLNFANIIALPLLFGIGVAFHIYFVMAWRAGGSHLLQSSLTKAIFFSALATATGFGSLWASSHPGTASMGKLLMISLLWTLVSALLFQPALMGPPPLDRGKP